MGGVVSDVVGGVGDIVGGVGDAVGDVVGSDLGKAALLAGGAYYGAPYLMGEGGVASVFGGGAPELLGEASGMWAGGSAAAPSILGGLGLGNLSTGAALGLGAAGLTAAKALGGDKPTSSTTSTAIDPEMKAAYLRNLEEARTTAAGLAPKQFANFSGTYGTAEEQLRNIGLGGAGQAGTAEAARLTGQLAGFTPQQIQAGTGAQYMGAYQNPYENQVVQSTINDLDMARMRQQLADRAAASAAKAFGGSRQGVAEALTNEASMRNMGSVVSNLRSQGFNTAAQLGQTDAARMLAAAGSNQAADISGAGLRMNAAGQIGNLAAQRQNLGISGASAVMQAEAQRQALEQARLDAARNLELERLGIRQGALSLQPANLGGTQTNPIYRNTSASALGGALSGGMLGNMIGGASGAGYGALAGGLLGFL